MWSKSCEIFNPYEAIMETFSTGFLYVYVEDEGRYAVVWFNNGKLFGRYLDDPEYNLRSFDIGKEYLRKPRWNLRLFVLIAKFRVYDWWQRR